MSSNSENSTHSDPVRHDGPVSLPGLLDRIGESEALDGPVGALRRFVRGVPLSSGVRDVLHGRWLGHPLHPALVQLPMGAWLSSAVLDALPGRQRSARTLVGVGVVAAVPAAVAGWVDWAEQHEHQARTGLVHAGAIGLTIWLYSGSWIARARNRHGLGRALGLAGLTTGGIGAMLGGDLAYRHAAGVNKAEPIRHVLEDRWYDIGHTGEFPEGVAVRRQAAEVSLLVVREAGSGGAVRVLAERCNYCSGPLSEGEIVDGAVKCPWHGSVFRLVDGWNIAGPATSPQPCFDVRAREDGVVQVRYSAAG